MTVSAPDPVNWERMLNAVVVARELQAPPLYLVESSGKLSERKVVPVSLISSDSKKLSLKAIVNATTSEFRSMPELLEAGKISTKEYTELGNKLSNLANKLIDQRIAKRNQFAKVFLRKLAYVIAFLSCFLLGLGIPLFRRLKKMDNDFESEIRTLKGKIFNAKVRSEKALEVKRFVTETPTLVEELQKDVSDEDVRNWIQRQVDHNYPTGKELTSRKVKQFENDIARGIRFLRKDLTHQIEDQLPQPNQKLTGTERVTNAAALVDELLKSEKDKEWKIALQLVTNQTSLNSLFENIMATFGFKAVDEYELQWIVDGNHYTIKLAFSEKQPPITLEIVRDKHTDEITKINVEVNGILDVIEFNANDSDFPTKKLVPGLIEGNLRYSVTLNDQGRPVISAVERDLEVHLEEEILTEKKAAPAA